MGRAITLPVFLKIIENCILAVWLSVASIRFEQRLISLKQKNTTSSLSLINKYDIIIHFLAPSLTGTGLGHTPVNLCPLILTMFGYTIFVGNTFAHLFLSLFAIINSKNGDLNMLHGLEFLILSSGTGTGNWIVRVKTGIILTC